MPKEEGREAPLRDDFHPFIVQRYDARAGAEVAPVLSPEEAMSVAPLDFNRSLARETWSDVSQ